MKLNKAVWLLLFATVTPAEVAQAQGAFNVGTLGVTLSIPRGQQHARKSGAYRAAVARPSTPRRRTAAATPPPRITAADRAALSFRRDPALSERLKQRFIAGFPTADIRAQATRNLANATPKILAAMKPTGMQYNNLADAQATYLVTMWQATHRQYTDDPSQFRRVSNQFVRSNLKVGAQKLSNADKQEMAETLIYEAMFIGGLFPDARTDKTLQRALADAASRGSKNNFGFDIANIRMTPTGLME